MSDILTKCSALLSRHVNDSQKVGPDGRAAPVMKFLSPTDLTQVFDEAGLPLDLSTPLPSKEKLTDEGVMDMISLVIESSVNTRHPLFMNQLYGAVNQVGLAGDWAASALSTNVHTYEVGPALTMMEHAVVDRFAKLVGYSAGTYDGIMPPGGSSANIYAVHCARQHALGDDVRTMGTAKAAGGRSMVAFTTAESHYSFKKAMILLGLGTDNLVLVPTDAAGSMIPAALKECVDEVLASGGYPFFVGCTCGTTVRGSFDPLPGVADVCEKYNLWLHADGAWGGACIFSQKNGHLVVGSSRTDSFTTNPHKMFGAPHQCSVFVTRRKGVLKAANSSSASYLFQPDKNFLEYDIGDHTHQCGRRGDALKLWLMLRYHGEDGMARIVDAAIAKAEHVASRVTSNMDPLLDEQGRPVYALATQTSYANTCFFFVPRELRSKFPVAGDAGGAVSVAAALKDLTPAELEVLNAAGPRIKNLMQRSGGPLIGYQKIASLGLPNCFRIVFAGDKAEALTTEMLDVTLEFMWKLYESGQVTPWSNKSTPGRFTSEERASD